MALRPDRPGSSRGVLLLTLLPLLLGGGPSSPTARPHPFDDAPPETLWVFLSPQAWESPSVHARLAAQGRIRVRSEWLRAVSVEVEKGAGGGLKGLPGVLEVRPVRRLEAPPSPIRVEMGEVGKIPRGLRNERHPDPSAVGGGGGPDGGIRPVAPLQVADTVYGSLGVPLEALGIPQAHGLGFLGSGVRVGILDGSYLGGHATLRTRSPLATRDLVDLDSRVYPDPADPPETASHGTALWSLVAGNLPGVLVGSAPEADVILARIRGLGELQRVDEDRWVEGLEWLESQGARVVISGVGFRIFPDFGYPFEELNGDGTAATRAADEAARRGVLVVAPVGNDGPGLQTLEAPADGDSVLAAGAVDNRGVPAAFSALGPTADGRLKPDLFAPGLGLEAASALGEETLEEVSGTEFAGALLAGVLALVVEAHPNQGPLEILEMLRLSATPVEGAEGGVPNTASAILFPHGLFPLPLGEVDGEGQVTDLAPEFQWTAPTLHPMGLPVTFHLEFSEDPDFGNLTVSDSVVGTFARRPPFPLPPRSRLFWRIRASTVQGVERVAVSEDPIRVPSWVDLEVLDDPSGSESVDPQPEFRWSAPPVSPPAGPLVYELQVVSDREGEVIQAFPGLDVNAFRLPEPLPFNLPLRWRVIAQGRTDGADTVTSSGPFVVTSGAKPPATILYQNFPNPFPNQEVGVEGTRVWFDLARSSEVMLAVYDMRGRLIRSLIPGRGCSPVELDPGLYGRQEGEEDECASFSWDGRDDRGREVPPGVYLLRLTAGGVVNTRRVVYWP